MSRAEGNAPVLGHLIGDVDFGGRRRESLVLREVVGLGDNIHRVKKGHTQHTTILVGIGEGVQSSPGIAGIKVLSVDTELSLQAVPPIAEGDAHVGAVSVGVVGLLGDGNWIDEREAAVVGKL